MRILRPGHAIRRTRAALDRRGLLGPILVVEAFFEPGMKRTGCVDREEMQPAQGGIADFAYERLALA